MGISDIMRAWLFAHMVGSMPAGARGIAGRF